MAIPHIKGTYTLDARTVRLLEGMARRWGVSKSEALRRAIRTAAINEGADADPRLGTLDRLQRAANLSATVAATWARAARGERRTTKRARRRA